MRRSSPLDNRGGVGEASNPGGLEGDGTGSSSIWGEQSSSSAGLGMFGTSAADRASFLMDLGDGGRTVVGDSGGETGGVRLS